ncbi:hypothetical protein [Hydrogenophaga sp.]|uniref:hypothetical protein n=1 Tax=Hydrogenophaga sp. TaxID=1904254 RepID=UPI002720EB58|nr:hypothetical protein [Hydrogenophaga sp.]MDO9133205.1 hypothetical protein [Hydrogenophaga sp.]
MMNTIPSYALAILAMAERFRYFLGLEPITEEVASKKYLTKLRFERLNWSKCADQAVKLIFSQ